MKEYNNKLNLKNESKNKKEISDTASQNVAGGEVIETYYDGGYGERSDYGYYSSHDEKSKDFVQHIYWSEDYGWDREAARKAAEERDAQLAKKK